MDINISDSTIACLFFTAIVLALLPIAAAAFWKMKKKRDASLISFVIGAAGFVVSARVLEMIPHIFCIVLDTPASRFITGSTVAYVLYGIAMAGIFEECGRYIIIRFFMKKRQTRENAVMYGIGHGGVEVWLISLVSVILYITIALTVNSQGASAASETYGAAMISAVAAFGAGSASMMILERVICMGIHVALTVIVFTGVKTRNLKYLLCAILLHAVFDIFPALYQRGAVSIAVSEIWIAAWLVVTGIFAWKLYAKAAAPTEEIQAEE
ncbi:MAG: YhfC family glutamic-type intramembrane protease [Oscillospiraceae bacterium]|nr:YhfC family glutamic-type intramembrane protease [Oscillospiraceae bacterium]